MCEEKAVNDQKHINAMLDWCWKVVKRRLPPGDVLFKEGDIFCRIASKYVPLDVKQEISTHRLEAFTCCVGRCTQVFDTLHKYESHYNSVHRNVCSVCNRIFPSCHLLEIHVLESHDSMFALLATKQDMFQCLVEDCRLKFNDTKARKNHMIKVHKYPANYRYDRQNKASKSDTKKSEVKRRESTGIADNASTNSEKENVPVTMETDSSGTESPNRQASNRVFSYKVPKNISFGQGISRGFLGNRGRGRGRRSNKKHWHNMDSQDTDTSVNIENMDMLELGEALT